MRRTYLNLRSQAYLSLVYKLFESPSSLSKPWSTRTRSRILEIGRCQG